MTVCFHTEVTGYFIIIFIDISVKLSHLKFKHLTNKVYTIEYIIKTFVYYAYYIYDCGFRCTIL